MATMSLGLLATAASLPASQGVLCMARIQAKHKAGCLSYLATGGSRFKAFQMLAVVREATACRLAQASACFRRCLPSALE